MNLIATGRMPHGKDYLKADDPFTEPNEQRAKLLVQIGRAKVADSAAPKKKKEKVEKPAEPMVTDTADVAVTKEVE